MRNLFGHRLSNLSLIAKFNLISLVILLIGSAATGWWITDQIESNVLLRAGHATSMFTGSVVAPLVEDLLQSGNGPDDARLDDVLNLAGLGEKIVAFKVWSSNGQVIHSSNRAEIGRSFEVESNLERAWNGEVSAEISQLERPEHFEQRKSARRLLEIYTPVRQPGTGTILAVLEFYQSVSEFEREIRGARIQTWGIVAGLVAVIYLSLVLLVRGGSRTIVHQRDEMERRVREYQRVVVKNTQLDERLRATAARTTALNEEYLRGIAADLHDGPAQDIGYALLKMNDSSAGEPENSQTTLKRALDDIRNISAGLRSPELDGLSLGETVRRAVRGHQNRSGQTVTTRCSNLPQAVSLANKITVFRVIQESLTNASRHSGDDSPTVSVAHQNGWIELKIEDRGPGFSRIESNGTTHLGIAVMRERVELLGGEFAISSDHSTGTIVRVLIPTRAEGDPSDV